MNKKILVALVVTLPLCVMVKKMRSDEISSGSYYDLLAIEPTASQEEIEFAYQMLRKNWQYRVDTPSSDDYAQWKQINTAYQTLKNPTERQDYDEKMRLTPRTPRDLPSNVPVQYWPQFEENDYYKILGIAYGASDKEIKKAYKELILLFPYIESGMDPEEQELIESTFLKLINAYDTLSDPNLKRQYDQEQGYAAMAG